MNQMITIEAHVVTFAEYAAASPEGRKAIRNETLSCWMKATAWRHEVAMEAGRRVQAIMAAEFAATPQYLPRPLTKSGRPSTRPSPTNPAFSELCDRRNDMERDMFDVVKSERGIAPLKATVTDDYQVYALFEAWDRALKDAASATV